MQSLLDTKIGKAVGVALASVFLIQAIFQTEIVPLNEALKYFGVGEDGFAMIEFIFTTTLILIAVGFAATYLNQIHVLKGVTKNKIILNIVVKLFMAFIIFMLSWFLFSVLGGTGLFGENAKNLILIKQGISSPAFLDVYLFFYILASTFIRPEIVPEFGAEEDEKERVM